MSENVSLFKVFMSKEAKQNVQETLESGYISQGPREEEFKQSLCTYLNNEHVALVNSATSGLNMAFEMFQKPFMNWPGFDIGYDTVLLPSLTCWATTASVLYGRERVNVKWIDVDPCTLSTNIDHLETLLTKRTKIIYCILWGGTPIDYEKLQRVRTRYFERYGFYPKIIQDCAHAFGSKFQSQHVSKFTNVSIHSFQAIKTLSTGDGGAVVLGDEKWNTVEELKHYQTCINRMKWFGLNKTNFNRDVFDEYAVYNIGFKFHMNDINASMGLGNIGYIDELVHAQRQNAEKISKYFENIEFVTSLENQLSQESSRWLYTIRLHNNIKHKFVRFCQSKNIQVSSVHQRNDKYSIVEYTQDICHDLSFLDAVENEYICVPCGWWLNNHDLAYMFDSWNAFFDDCRQSSYINSVNTLEMIRSITWNQLNCQDGVKNIAEFGILHGHSLDAIIESAQNSEQKTCISAYDLFECKTNDCFHRTIHETKEKYRDLLSVSQNVSEKVSLIIEQQSLYDSALFLDDNSLDMLHVDIGNCGDTYEYVLLHMLDKLKPNGLIIMEGGSVERDNVPWMKTFNKVPIRTILEKHANNISYQTFGSLPSITCIRKKKFLP